MKPAIIASIVLIVIAFASCAYFYDQLPDRIISHWDAAGQANGYMPKLIGILLMPVISLLMLGLFIALPRIDPMKKNIKSFRNYYDFMIFILIAFMFYLHAITLAANLGYSFNMIQFMSPALAALFFFIGILLKKSKRNWFVGIRTPWTMSSDKVWKSTHDRASILFKLTGIIALAGIILPDYAIIFILVPILFTAAYSFAFSYFEYKKLGKKK